MFSHIKRTLISRGYWDEASEDNPGGGGDDVVGEGNPHDAARAALVAGHDERVDESGDFIDPDAEPAAAEEEEEAQPPAAEETPKHKIKVNGEEQELTVEELIALAQKGVGAEQKFEEAARLRREAEEMRAQPKEEPSKPDAQPEELDAVALVRALQMGTEAEAAEAVKKLIGSRPSFKDDELAARIDDRLQGKQAMDRFKSEFKEIVADPELLQFAFARDQQMIAAGDKRGYWERFEDIGNSMVKKFNLRKAETKIEEKEARKAEVVPIKRASAKPAAASEPDTEENASDVISNMAKARGQSRP